MLIHAMPDAGPRAGEAAVPVAERARLDNAVEESVRLFVVQGVGADLDGLTDAAASSQTQPAPREQERDAHG